MPGENGLPITSVSPEQIFESAPDSMIVVDDSGLVVAANSRTTDVLGYEPATLIGRPVEDLIPPDQRGGHIEKREAYFESPHVRPMGAGLRLHALHRDGRSIPVDIRLSPCTAAGRTYVVGTIRDVSRLRQMEDDLLHRGEELEASNHELEQFAYVASHDLQEPLRHIMGFCQILQDDHRASLDEDGHHCLDVVIEATGRMRDLINDLLDYSRAGRRDSTVTAIEVQEVMDIVLSNVDGAIRECEADVVVGPMPRIEVDSFQLISVLQNLISNAIKFRREGVAPRVEIRAEREGDSAWRFSVLDNGIGIEPDHNDRIFEIFQKLHSRHQYDGTGIGLAVVRKMVTNLGGKIWVESTPGEGSTFSFVLPEYATETREEDHDQGNGHGTARRRQPA